MRDVSVLRAACLAGTILLGTPAMAQDATQRVAALVAGNRALSAENAIPTTFRTSVSLADADVVAKAKAQSDQAGHNGLHYDYFLIRAALDKARAMKADKLDLPTATYRIYPPANFPQGQGVLEVNGQSHLVIDGHGSTLLFKYIGTGAAPLNAIHPRAGIHLVHSDHIALRDVVLDWDEALAVPVTVHGSGTGQTLTVDPAFPIDPGSPMGITVFLPFDVAKRDFFHSRDMAPADFDAWHAAHGRGGSMPYTCAAPSVAAPSSNCFRYTGGQTYAFGPNEHFRPMPPHDGNFLATVRNNNFAAIVGDGPLSYVTLSGVTITSSPGAGIQFIGSGPALHLDHIRIVRKPGDPKRFLSTMADGVNFITTAGDIVLENSEIANQADDGLNVDAQLRRGQATGPQSVSAAPVGVSGFYRVGGLVDLYDAKGNALVVAGAKITAATPQAGSNRVALTFDAGQLAPGTGYLLRVHDFDSSRVVVRNTWFHDNSERGVIVHGSDIALVGNRFEHNAESAIQALYDNVSGDAEGAPVSNLIIAGNMIHDVNTAWFDPATRMVAPPAAIAVYFGARSGFSGAVPGSGVAARDVMIVGNMIAEVPGAGILASQVQGLTVVGNKVAEVGQHRFGVPLLDGKAIVIEASKDVHVAGNQANAPIVGP